MKKAKRRPARKDLNVYPLGWDYRRARNVAEYYDARKDEPVLNNPKLADVRVGLVWMEIPHELVPEVRKLIARRRRSA